MSKAHEQLVTLCEQSPVSRPKDEPVAPVINNMAAWLESLKQSYRGKPKQEPPARPPYVTLNATTTLSEGQKPVPRDQSLHYRLLNAAGR